MFSGVKDMTLVCTRERTHTTIVVLQEAWRFEFNEARCLCSVLIVLQSLAGQGVLKSSEEPGSQVFKYKHGFEGQIRRSNEC